MNDLCVLAVWLAVGTPLVILAVAAADRAGRAVFGRSRSRRQWAEQVLRDAGLEHAARIPGDPAVSVFLEADGALLLHAALPWEVRPRSAPFGRMGFVLGDVGAPLTEPAWRAVRDAGARIDETGLTLVVPGRPGRLDAAVEALRGLWPRVAHPPARDLVATLAAAPQPHHLGALLAELGRIAPEVLAELAPAHAEDAPRDRLEWAWAVRDSRALTALAADGDAPEPVSVVAARRLAGLDGDPLAGLRGRWGEERAARSWLAGFRARARPEDLGALEALAREGFAGFAEGCAEAAAVHLADVGRDERALVETLRFPAARPRAFEQLAEVGTVAAVPHLLRCADVGRDAAVRAIQARLVGAEVGQLAEVGSAGGGLSAPGSDRRGRLTE